MAKKGIKELFDDIIDSIKHPKDFTSAYSASDINDNKFFAFLSYIPLFGLYSVFVESKKSAFVKFHANQGLVLWLAYTAITLVMLILFILFGITIIGLIVSFFITLVEMLFALAYIGLTAFGIYLSFSGQAKELPVVGRFKILK